MKVSTALMCSFATNMCSFSFIGAREEREEQGCKEENDKGKRENQFS
jgi:hypothetical protein